MIPTLRDSCQQLQGEHYDDHSNSQITVALEAGGLLYGII